jgi:hypothetical protein
LLKPVRTSIYQENEEYDSEEEYESESDEGKGNGIGHLSPINKRNSTQLYNATTDDYYLQKYHTN